MKEKPILFSTEMVRAILDGRKTQTRRIIKGIYEDDLSGFTTTEYNGEKYFTNTYEGVKYPYQIGDILWVRETWCDSPIGVIYKEKELREFGQTGDIKWRPSIHMPRSAARLFLRVTNVRVERLQDISERDCLKEGILYKGILFNGLSMFHNGDGKSYNNGRCAFEELWDRINKKNSNKWDKNPFVYVIEFERIEK